MINKEIIRQKINYTESLLQVYKNEYPKNISECWRKRAPFLVMIFSAVVPFGFLDNIGVATLMLLVIPFVLLVCLIEIIRCIMQYRRKSQTRTNVTDSLSTLSEYMEYSDIQQYCQQTSDTVSNLESSKKKMRRKANLLSLLLILITFAIPTVGIYVSMNYVEKNENMTCLGLDNFSTFDAALHKGGNVDVVSQNCTFRIESSFFEHKDRDIYEHFRLRALNLDVRGVKDDDILMLKIVNADGIPEAFFPEFIFEGRKLKDEKGIISSPQDFDKTPFENYEVLKKIKAGGLGFIVEKIN